MKTYLVAALFALPLAAGAIVGGLDSTPGSGDLIASSASRGVFLIEYWRCPAEHIGGLNQYQDSIWAPIFDELVDEGNFLAWGSLAPTTEEEWNWLGYWHAETEEAMDAAWTDFHARLQARFPDDPRPTRFCHDLKSVRYQVRRGR